MEVDVTPVSAIHKGSLSNTFVGHSLSLRSNDHFLGGPGLVSQYQNVSILDFIGAKDDEGGEW